MLEICVLLKVVNTSTRDTLEMDLHLRGEDKEWSERVLMNHYKRMFPKWNCDHYVYLWSNQIKTSHDKCYENKFLIVQFNANYNCIDLTFQLVIERNYNSETVISARSDYLAT